MLMTGISGVVTLSGSDVLGRLVLVSAGLLGGVGAWLLKRPQTLQMVSS